MSVFSSQLSVGKGREVLGLKDVTSSPGFFVSVASKKLRFPVSPLKSTLMGIFVSVASKRLRVHQICAECNPACAKITPSRVWVLKRYDSKGLRRWGSANDLIPWELGNLGQGIEFRLRKKLKGRGVPQPRPECKVRISMAATTDEDYHISTRCVNKFLSYHSNELVK